MRKKQIAILLVALCMAFNASKASEDSVHTYIHSQPESIGARFVQSVFSTFRVKQYLEKYMTGKAFSQAPANIPQSLLLHYNVSVSEKEGRKIWTFKPKQNPSRKVILYLHGGAYILNISSYQWKFVSALLKQTNATVVVPDYPLAPRSHCSDVYAFIVDLYQTILRSTAAEDIVVMGDSAGGGLSLGFAQQLKTAQLPQPAWLILLSPWLDVTMRNPDIAQYDKSDKMLGVKGLQLAGNAYAGSMLATNPMVSPLYGNCNGLAKIAIFIGTHDVFIADSRVLKHHLAEANVSLHYFEYPKMFHGWMVVTGLRESKCVLSQIKTLIGK